MKQLSLQALPLVTVHHIIFLLFCSWNHLQLDSSIVCASSVHAFNRYLHVLYILLHKFSLWIMPGIGHYCYIHVSLSLMTKLLYIYRYDYYIYIYRYIWHQQWQRQRMQNWSTQFSQVKTISRLCLRRDAYMFLPSRLHRNSIDFLFPLSRLRIFRSVYNQWVELGIYIWRCYCTEPYSCSLWSHVVATECSQ